MVDTACVGESRGFRLLGPMHLAGPLVGGALLFQAAAPAPPIALPFSSEEWQSYDVDGYLISFPAGVGRSKIQVSDEKIQGNTIRPPLPSAAEARGINCVARAPALV